MYKYVYYVLCALRICVKGEGYYIIIWTVNIILKVINGIGSSRMHIIVRRTYLRIYHHARCKLIIIMLYRRRELEK